MSIFTAHVYTTKRFSVHIRIMQFCMYPLIFPALMGCKGSVDSGFQEPIGEFILFLSVLVAVKIELVKYSVAEGMQILNMVMSSS